MILICKVELILSKFHELKLNEFSEKRGANARDSRVSNVSRAFPYPLPFPRALSFSLYSPLSSLVSRVN